ncbi:CPXCG motif-containing cysteine-rich protein [Lutimonas saemankumensis]|uniref:CPXCG motif-containing cysteine-rich protein n=1 Tax=Lutimonas saemankumensis TaxID=483016 RepID=UPI001CD35F28|nr:CPXCG motif-containing cysteine-rich protein [Lutimonas saemankumensis]MCA0931855.1 CPXCG motif-containing cysteine-rich protein [Lutimonas saemankumensis]
MEEQFFQCPYCWEEISILTDPSVTEQILVEDCEVCCNPIEITIVFDQGTLVSFESKDLGQ